IDLWPNRHRLYDGLRHYRHDQLCAWRCVYARRIYGADRFPYNYDISGGTTACASASFDDGRGDASDRALELGDRTHGLSAITWVLPAGAFDHCDRYVYSIVELRSGDTGAAQQAG